MKARHGLLYNVDVVQAHSIQLQRQLALQSAIAEAQDQRSEESKESAEIRKEVDYLKDTQHAGRTKANNDALLILGKRDETLEQVSQAQALSDNQQAAVEARLRTLETGQARLQQQLNSLIQQQDSVIQRQDGLFLREIEKIWKEIQQLKSFTGSG
ncbi:hypothetical protein BGX34_008965 [Mortierella sp. NVP85]|nr:hypothetical protein BGX34_008965 [Mortierella sp. NVP85]